MVQLDIIAVSALVTLSIGQVGLLIHVCARIAGLTAQINYVEARIQFIEERFP